METGDVVQPLAAPGPSEYRLGLRQEGRNLTGRVERLVISVTAPHALEKDVGDQAQPGQALDAVDVAAREHEDLGPGQNGEAVVEVRSVHDLVSRHVGASCVKPVSLCE